MAAKSFSQQDLAKEREDKAEQRQSLVPDTFTDSAKISDK